MPPKSQTNLDCILCAIATGTFKPLVRPAATDSTKDSTGSRINWKMHRAKLGDTTIFHSKFIFFSSSNPCLLASFATYTSPLFSPDLLSPPLLSFPSRVRKWEGNVFFFVFQIPLEDSLSLSLLLQGTFLDYFISDKFFSLILIKKKKETKLFFHYYSSSVYQHLRQGLLYIENQKKKRLKKQRYWTSVTFFFFLVFFFLFRVLQLGSVIISSPSFHALPSIFNLNLSCAKQQQQKK